MQTALSLLFFEYTCIDRYINNLELFSFFFSLGKTGTTTFRNTAEDEWGLDTLHLFRGKRIKQRFTPWPNINDKGIYSTVSLVRAQPVWRLEIHSHPADACKHPMRFKLSNRTHNLCQDLSQLLEDWRDFGLHTIPPPKSVPHTPPTCFLAQEHHLQAPRSS